MSGEDQKRGPQGGWSRPDPRDYSSEDFLDEEDLEESSESDEES